MTTGVLIVTDNKVEDLEFFYPFYRIFNGSYIVVAAYADVYSFGLQVGRFVFIPYKGRYLAGRNGFQEAF